MTTTPLPLQAFQSQVRRRVERALAGRHAAGGSERAAAFEGPPGDPGLFGPGSATWQVHGDLPAMLVGGVVALLLQTLHPLAMAGVIDHSAYRTDPMGRLRRTAVFVGTTTFGSTEAAMQAIYGVQAVHRRVRGTAPDGRPYDAADPELVAWIHVAEVWSFLRAYRRFGPAPLGDRAADRYVAEMAVIAGHLGAEDVPTSVAGLQARLAAFRPELRADAQALSGAAFIVNLGGQAVPPMPPAVATVQAVMVQAAIGLLPPWAREMLRLRRPLLPERLLTGISADASLATLRWAVGRSPALEAATVRCARIQDPPSPSRRPSGLSCTA